MFILRNGALCPICERGKLKRDKRDLLFKYKGKSRGFKNETTYRCDLCLYEILSKKSSRRTEKELSIFRSMIDRQHPIPEKCPYCKQKTFNNPCEHCNKLRPEIPMIIFGPVGYIDEYNK